MGAFFALFVVFGIIAIARSIQAMQARNLAWQRAAGRLGITMRASAGFRGFGAKPSMQGRVKGLAVKIDTVQSNETTYTRYRVRYPPLNLGLGLKRQTFFRSLGTKLGLTDIEVGDSVFDEAVVVKGDLPSSVKGFLTHGRRLAIRSLFEAYPNAVVSDSQIEVRLRGFEQDPNRIIAVLNRILGTAATITGADPNHERAADKRATGDLTAAIEELRTDAPADPWAEFTRKQAEVEMLYVEGVTQEAVRLADELVEEAPGDKVALRLQQLTRGGADRGRRASKPATEALPLEAADESELAVPAKPPATPPSAVIEGSPRTRQPEPAPSAPPLGKTGPEAASELFDPELYSFDTMELFENEYHGKLVSWEGTLIRQREFERDRELGHGPGIKAIFRLHEVDHGLFQGQGVDAVVGLPPSTALEAGAVYEFRGVLVACDAVIRNLYVSNGEIVAR